MPRLAQLAHRQKTSRLRDALAALALVGVFAVPAVAFTSTAETDEVAKTSPAPTVDTCGPTSVSVEC